MNSPVCVDASLVLKLGLPEEGSEQVEALWRNWQRQMCIRDSGNTIEGTKLYFCPNSCPKLKHTVLNYKDKMTKITQMAI